MNLNTPLGHKLPKNSITLAVIEEIVACENLGYSQGSCMNFAVTIQKVRRRDAIARAK